MQIEFYLPLPSDGFWAALIIYYMVGFGAWSLCVIVRYSAWQHRAKGQSANPVFVDMASGRYHGDDKN